MISCIVPAHKEENYIEDCLIPLQLAREKTAEEVEIIIVENGEKDGTEEIVRQWPIEYHYIPHACRIDAKNYGAEKARGNILVFVDADCLVSENFFQEISEKAKDLYVIGGGIKNIRLPRYSFGIYCFLLLVGLVLLWNQITIGAFWVKREVFEALGEFHFKILDDIDFAKRLKRYAKQNGYETSSLKESWLLWSTRKFDKYGDWYWLRGYK